jgi:hypothetical protein
MRGVTVAAIALSVVAVSLRWGSFVAGGSDSYCYVHQAERWADVLARPLTARLQVAEPLAFEAPWPLAAATFAPTGHIPSQTVPGAIVPICPPGLSILMAPLLLAGGPAAVFFVMPLFGAMVILTTYSAGARFGARIGVAAAALVACSPVVLYQVVQPMSDVPATALWMAAVAWATGTRRRDAILAGVATSVAILIRPNLLPLGLVIGAFLLLRPERTWTQRLRSAATFAAWCAPGCLAVGFIQQTFYGSPLASGYGSFDSLFAVEHVGPNARRYLIWLWQSHTPAIALAALAPFLLPGPLTALFVALFLTNLAVYLPYVVFEDWSFTRFLLPTIPLLLILVAAVIDAVIRRVAVGLLAGRGAKAGREGPPYVASAPPPFTGASVGRPFTGRRDVSSMRLVDACLALAVIVLAFLFVREAQARNAFRLQFLEARFAKAGRYVAAHLPDNALIVTSYESGSIRFYAGRKTIVWGELDRAWLDRLLAFTRTRGYEPYLLFERWEEPEFRRRFAESALGALDWPPAAEVASQVRIYRPEDRERYLHGDPVQTEFAP